MNKLNTQYVIFKWNVTTKPEMYYDFFNDIYLYKQDIFF